MDITDFRYRPPYGSCRETTMYRDLERVRRCSEAFGTIQPPAVAARNVEAFLTEMDRADIDMVVLAGRKVLPHTGVMDNQDIMDPIHAYPGRFASMAETDLSNGSKTAEKLEWYVVDEGLRNIVVEPGLTRAPIFVEDGRIFPLYERCQVLGVPVILMVGFSCRSSTEYSKPECAGWVAEAFPELNIIFPHGGWPWITEVIRVTYRYRNVYLLLDLYQFSGSGNGEYLAIANCVLRDQVLFGSAYPYISLQEAVDYFPEGRLRPEARPAFLVGNARRILELEHV